SLFAYVKAKKHPNLANIERPFKAPKGWTNVAMIFGLFNLPFCVIGVVYLNSLEIGWSSTWLGFVVLAFYIPIWLFTQYELRRSTKAAPAPALTH
ncbi:MAG: amino acid permease, partial [Micrococcaceae bacterium]|nr:amino acid permease [Micrococcaceae bacterium]